jgi:murein DD-endopeptidase MepM/ murein hydrolase activator NlpD
MAMFRIGLLIITLTLLLGSFHPTSAQEQPQPDGPVYIVQEGDNLWEIALRFGVSLSDLQSANNLGADQPISVGMKLIIPGFENLGISGVLTTSTVGYGENLDSLSRRSGVPVEVLARLNRLVSPNEIYAGMPLVLVESEVVDSTSSPIARPMLAPGQSLLELAVLRGENPWTLAHAAGDLSPGAVLPGQVLWLANVGASLSPGAAIAPGGFPDAVSSVSVNPLPVGQGRTLQLTLSGESGMNLDGSLAGHFFDFFANTEREYDALQGVHAMLDPGFYPLVITGTLSTGESFTFSQPIYIKAGDYVYDPTLIVSPETIDPAVTKPEDAQWAALTTPVTPEKFWNGQFQAPVPPDFAACFPSRFGSRRSYNDGPYNYFHTGLDFCGNNTTDVLAPAAGRVVFAGPLTVRGNATIIDHGQGIYTGYLHQSKLLVQAGEMVQPGQVIGKIGATGRVTGPHLHWEVWVNGVQVDPLDWLATTFE